VTLIVESGGKEGHLEADVALLCIGRRPYTKGLNLEAAGIAPDQRGFIPINGSFQTAQSHIYAIGDVVDGPMLAHKASEEGVIVADHLVGRSHPIHYVAIPSVIYTYPEVASVGFTEEQAKEYHLAYKVGEFPLSANSRAGCMGESDGFVKLIAHEPSGKLLGMHIIAPHAGELIHEGVLALEKGATAWEIAASSHAHPTLAEAIKEAALALTSKPIHR
jgi:dihydrolipoamide dehydrogenase